MLKLPQDHLDVERSLSEIRTNIESEAEMGEVTWTEVFTQGKTKNLQRVLLGMGPYMMNQWSGINSECVGCLIRTKSLIFTAQASR